MRTSLLCIAFIFTVAQLDAAPAPAPSNKAKEKLESLKKQLPEIVSSWAKERWYPNASIYVRVVRRLGPSQAKVVLMSRALDGKGGRTTYSDKVFTVFLDFYYGMCPVERFEVSWPERSDFENRNVRFLMLAIDEAAEK